MALSKILELFTNQNRTNPITFVVLFILQKLWFQYMWPILEQEIRSQEALAAALEPVLFLVNECSAEEYSAIILPVLR